MVAPKNSHFVVELPLVCLTLLLTQWRDGCDVRAAQKIHVASDVQSSFNALLSLPLLSSDVYILSLSRFYFLFLLFVNVAGNLRSG